MQTTLPANLEDMDPTEGMQGSESTSYIESYVLVWPYP